VEDVLNVIDRERPEGIIVQFGGQTPLKIANDLQRALDENPIPAASGGSRGWAGCAARGGAPRARVSPPAFGGRCRRTVSESIPATCLRSRASSRNR
jgi:hypothetical protein